MANSRKKYTRARIRAAGRRPRKRGGSSWFYAAIGLIVVLGIVGVIVARPDSSSATPPQPGDPTTGAPGDHWHAALAANVCGEWIAPPATFETAADNPNVRVGIHTHGDGFMHIHPFTKSEGGDNATFGRFLSYGGWSASEGSLSLWTGPTFAPGTKSWSDGDKCPAGSPFAGKAGVVKWSVDCVAKTGNPSDLKLKDGEVVAVAFLPRSEDIGVPPNATAAPANDGGTTTALSAKGCSTAGPGGTAASTTVPAATDSTTPSSTP
jgi:hypothetical protein